MNQIFKRFSISNFNIAPTLISPNGPNAMDNAHGLKLVEKT